MEGTNKAIEFIVNRLQNEASDINAVLTLNTARLTYFHLRVSTLAVLKSITMRATATSRSSSVRKVAVWGDEGRIRNAAVPMMMEMSPSKKNMLRQVWMIPHCGTFVNPLARRPPNAPLATRQHLNSRPTCWCMPTWRKQRSHRGPLD